MRVKSIRPLQENPDSEIHHGDLFPGDILFVRDEKRGIFKHICVVARTQCDGIYNRIHTAGLGNIKGLIVSAMFSHEQLKQANSSVSVVRILDEKIRTNFLKILENWATWAVSYDSKRLNTLCEKLSEFYGAEFNAETKTCPNMNEIPDEKISHALSECTKLFRIEDTVKYAQRREITPIKPKENVQDERGFSCTMPIIAALQATYVMEEVSPVNGKWCSNKHAFFANPLSEALKNHDISLEEYKNNLVDLIPEELRLPVKMTDCDLLLRSILKGKSCKMYGRLSAPGDHLFSHRNEIEDETTRLGQLAQKKKDEFRRNVFGK